MSFPFVEVKKSIDGLRSKLQHNFDELFQHEFDAGLHPNLLSYKGEPASGNKFSPLSRYIVGATSYLHQPSHYYDIYGAGRSVILVGVLDQALELLLERKVKGLDGRLKRLVQAVNVDSFDSVAFELITAARYAEQPQIDHIELIDERPPKKTPDILLSSSGVDSFVECKKVARVKDFSAVTRGKVRVLLNGVLDSFRKMGISAVVEVTFTCDPKTVTQSTLIQATQEAFYSGTPIITPQFTVQAATLPTYDNKDYTLYPSPRFAWIRYGYRIRGQWFGLVNHAIGTPRYTNLPKHLHGGLSAWLDSIDWDAGIKWKIRDEDVVAKYRRFGFDALFQAIQQINGLGLNSSVHLRLESDYYIGGRREALHDFFQRLCVGTHPPVAWITINETLIDVSPKGRFDLIEHAHMISGPTAISENPLVSGVFGLPEVTAKQGEFGVGNELPDIDED